ncbi:MAG: hypothetical protein DRI77_09335 [Chloroflexi bacterium]|nr:MAG: hypothetical protein DRI77_09335 [Chloroflexota bacterium]
MRGFAFKNRVFWHRKMVTCGRVAHFPTQLKHTHLTFGQSMLPLKWYIQFVSRSADLFYWEESR